MKLLNLNLLLTTIFLTTNLVGCATQIAPTKDRIVYVSVPLDKPTKPEIPKIPGREMSCLSDQTKNALIKRDVVIKNYIAELEAVIDSTHNK